MLLTIIKVCLVIGIGISILTYQSWLYERARDAPGRRVMEGRGLADILGAAGVALVEGLAWGAAILLTPFAFLGDFLAVGRKRGPQRPVLLVHGYLHNRTAWVAHGVRLRRAGWTAVYSINLWPPSAPLETFAQQVAEAVERICREMDTDAVDIVGHSMGGVVSRAYVHFLDGHERVAHLVTLGSPHHGTHTAPLGPWANSLQMATTSPYLAEMNDATDSLHGVATTAIYSEHDNIIIPAESGALPPPATTHMVRRMGHVGMLWSPAVWRLIEEALRQESEAES